MKYSSNPRKVYGKVEIIYADEELTRDARIDVSGNSEISNPTDVYKNPYEPTVKACTMDGNSTMDGTFQMMSNKHIVGWWSGKLADSKGEFSQKPYIELSFVMRPIIYWRILGDSKLNQYPVDFVVEYKRNGVVVKTEKVMDNTNFDIILQPRVADITSIRMTINKWNTPNSCAKILRFFEKVYETYEGQDLQSFEVGEELSSAEANYNINSDSMSVSIYNENRKFDKGYLRSLMLLDRKLIPYIGVENNGKIEYTQLGIFYSDTWDISQDSQWVKCMATDRLLRLQKRMYVGFPLVENVSLYEITEDILQKAGLIAEEYIISDNLKDIVIGMALLPKTTIWDALQEIANAALCKIFVDRYNRIVIMSEKDGALDSAIEITPSNAFSYMSNISLTDFSNSVTIEYFDISVSEDIIDVVEAEIKLEPKENKTFTFDYTSEVANTIAISNNAMVKIISFTSGVNSCLCELDNNSDVEQTVVITISGNAINIDSRTITIKDDDSILTYGLVECSHTASELVQSYEQAEYIATILLAKTKAGEGSITAEWRGNPELEIGLAFNLIDRFEDNEKLLCEYNKFTYDGGLKQETRGRKLYGGNNGELERT